ncbi:hypothetical protein IWQ60_002340 [Tieghemiomyces parasiticus]|uniref:FF domain-containing protein n=1 Tax=Tieghemiomyces parasiticus TaxID=78921 RepID=A0A9W8DXH4_9FUNG|nr:hypothetical protein IWQ60_002340 [Tieghemiomyces parasiticus]
MDENDFDDQLALLEEEEGQGYELTSPPHSPGSPAIAEVSTKPQSLTEAEQDEGFKQLLADLNLTPFASWDHELPRMSQDQRFNLPTTEKRRMDLFNEYCAELVQLRRQQKAAATTKADPRPDFERLVREKAIAEMPWAEFQRKFKKERAFIAVVSLKEKKAIFEARIQQLTAKSQDTKADDSHHVDEAFMQLLRETRGLHRDSSWTKTKAKLDRESAYRAVDSPSHRERLFRSYTRRLDRRRSPSRERTRRLSRSRSPPRADYRRSPSPSTKARNSLRERERQVEQQRREQLQRMDHERDRVHREAARRAYQTWLVDTIRDHTTSWHEADRLLERDGTRWEACRALGRRDREDLFRAHRDVLKARRLAAFHQLLDEHFARHTNLTTTTTTSWSELYPKIARDPRCVRLSADPADLERIYEAYQTEAQTAAERALAQLVQESWFARFQLRQAVANESVQDALRDTKTVDIVAATMAEEEGLGSDDEENTKAAVRRAAGGAGSVQDLLGNLKELHQVLRNDRRYLVFSDRPAERDRLIQKALENMVGSARQQSLYSK